MKKSTILGVLTAAALITTSAATYAAWDKTTATSENTIPLRPGVNLQATSNVTFEGGKALSTGDGGLTYTGEVIFTAENTTDLVDTLTLTPIVTKGDNSNMPANSYTITIAQTDDTLTGNSTNGYIDSKVDNGQNKYQVTLNVTDNNLADETVKVNIKGDLSKAVTE